MEPTEIRELVKATLPILGCGGAKSLGCQMLYRNRDFAGLHFSFEAVSAIWLADSDHIRFFNHAGKLVKIVRLQNQEMVNRAA